MTSGGSFRPLSAPDRQAPTDQALHSIGIVEDDPRVQASLRSVLSRRGFRVTCYDRGEGLLIHHDHLDAVLLDLGLPGLEGTEVLTRLRRLSDIPVIVLTARSDEKTAVACLSMGADDYMAKPVRLAELLARIDTQLRKSKRVARQPTSRGTSLPSLSVDHDRRTVGMPGTEVSLTVKEYALLSCLIALPGLAFSRESLIIRIWGHHFDGRSLDVLVASLRRKLAAAGVSTDVIATIRGYGYALHAREQATTEHHL